MIISRGVPLCYKLYRNVAAKQVRNMSGHAWSYRVAAPPHSKATIYSAEVIGAFMWWWILWHLFTEPEHITGEFPYPNPSKWTDEELGITAGDE